ncbi:hypothetical protein [uncultured Thiodictyon sp.]|uniref:hypothetical protein n=1 Tax=uncultured Thiodictyon sp. TaxID=1846217 RepID=UPI0025E03519|nr:hypothetical protein [uncultured Thiodictyon sp.]
MGPRDPRGRPLLRIVCFAEAPADARVGSGLGDRILAEEGPDPVDAARLPGLRAWTGLDSALPFTKLQTTCARRGC